MANKQKAKTLTLYHAELCKLRGIMLNCDPPTTKAACSEYEYQQLVSLYRTLEEIFDGYDNISNDSDIRTDSQR